MQNFDGEYYFILPEYKKGFVEPSPVPLDRLCNIPYSHKALALDAKPVIFYDNSLEFSVEKPLVSLPEILFRGYDLIVKGDLREALLTLKIPNLAMNAVSFIDHKKHTHHDLWYLAFLKRFYGWDKLSRFTRVKISANRVHRYSLNHTLLAKTPLQDRLLLKLDEPCSGQVMVHESIAYLFRKSGVTVLPVSEYEDYAPWSD